MGGTGFDHLRSDVSTPSLDCRGPGLLKPIGFNNHNLETPTALAIRLRNGLAFVVELEGS